MTRTATCTGLCRHAGCHRHYEWFDTCVLHGYMEANRCVSRSIWLRAHDAADKLQVHALPSSSRQVRAVSLSQDPICRGRGIRDHGHIAFQTSEGHLGVLNWPLAGDPADCIVEPMLPVSSPATLRAPAIPVAFCANARSILMACPLSDVILQLEVRRCSCWCPYESR